jgi:DNA-binding MarR family transcriptional regulator
MMTFDKVNLDDWQLLAQFSQVFRTVSDEFADQVELHRGQAVLLCTVAAQDGLTQSEIADQLSVQGATVTNMLQRMEESGLVMRRRDEVDNRLVRVYITEAGLLKERSINAQFGRMQAMIFKGISEDERAHLRRLLRHLLQNMEASI